MTGSLRVSISLNKTWAVDYSIVIIVEKGSLVSRVSFRTLTLDILRRSSFVSCVVSRTVVDLVWGLMSFLFMSGRPGTSVTPVDIASYNTAISSGTKRHPAAVKAKLFHNFPYTLCISFLPQHWKFYVIQTVLHVVCTEFLWNRITVFTSSNSAEDLISGRAIQDKENKKLMLFQWKLFLGKVSGLPMEDC